MMKVYALVIKEEYEYTEALSVHMTEAGAKAAAAKLQPALGEWTLMDGRTDGAIYADISSTTYFMVLPFEVQD